MAVQCLIGHTLRSRILNVKIIGSHILSVSCCIYVPRAEECSLNIHVRPALVHVKYGEILISPMIYLQQFTIFISDLAFCHILFSSIINHCLYFFFILILILKQRKVINIPFHFSYIFNSYSKPIDIHCPK